MELLIKNMVCPRCIAAVADTLSELEIPTLSVELGKVKLAQSITDSQKNALSNALSTLGFELLEDAKSVLISQIKTLIIDHVHHQDKFANLNISDLLTAHIPHDYGYLSRLFSGVEGVTIEKFYTRHRVEKVKELLFYGEMSLSEIADQLGYSSAAYLSAIFKKETGMTPGEFKRQGTSRRIGVDKI